MISQHLQFNYSLFSFPYVHQLFHNLTGISLLTFSVILSRSYPVTMRETRVQSLGQEDTLEKGIPVLQYSCLENPMDQGVCGATTHGVAKSRTRLSDFTG